jgi:hypothetical protein
VKKGKREDRSQNNQNKIVYSEERKNQKSVARSQNKNKGVIINVENQ